MRETQEAFERLLRAAEAGERELPLTTAADQEAAELVAMAERLHRMQHVRLSPDARQRILARAINTPVPARRGNIIPFPKRPISFPTRHLEFTRTAARVAASVAVVVALGGTVSASAASLPDSPLYPVKLLVDDVRVAVAAPDDKPRLYTEQATQRLRETEVMIENGNIPAAEHSATDAARRLAAARTSVETTTHPEVAMAIDKAVDRAETVNKRIEAQGGTPPKPPSVVASLVSPTPRPAAATVGPADTAPTTPTEEATPTPEPTAVPTGVPAVGAPQVGFTPIAGNPQQQPPVTGAVLVAPSPTPTEVRVVAPVASAFVPIPSVGQSTIGGSTPSNGVSGPVGGAPLNGRATPNPAPAAPVNGFVPIEPVPATRSLPTAIVPPTLLATATVPPLLTLSPTATPTATKTVEPLHTTPPSPTGQATPAPTRSGQ